MLMAGMC